MLVPPSAEFIGLVFALLKAGAVGILIDPGMGRRSLIGCLAEARPEGFVAIGRGQIARRMFRRRFPLARFNVIVGPRRWPRDVTTLDELAALGDGLTSEENAGPLARGANDPAAIIFTTGSTGPPKGVLYHHAAFDTQVEQLQAFYQVRPGEIDLPGFPLFGLFNAAMGVTTVLPQMDPTRPARVDPRKIIAAINTWQVTQAFGSPAIWNRVGAFCTARSHTLPTLARVLAAGAPAPAHVLEQMTRSIAPGGDMHTPYGATEALPVASIAASEVLGHTIAATRSGAGVCVGRKFASIAWKIIRIVDGPIAELREIEELPAGQIGELIVSGPQVTRCYVTRVEANHTAKIVDGERIWHRMGDVGYFDAEARFWYCGRMAHRVRTIRGTLYTEQCEAIYNNHPAIYRSALVGVGLVGAGPAGARRPVIICEPWPGQWPLWPAARRRLMHELRALGHGSPLTAEIDVVLLRRALPVDIRHNAKIFRERLAPWAEARLKRRAVRL